MTNKEAVKILKDKINGKVDTSYEWVEAVGIAIKALEENREFAMILENGKCALCGKPLNKNRIFVCKDCQE